MHAHFANEQSRTLFIEWLVELIAMIFEISDEGVLSNIHNDMLKLGNEELIRKKQLIEDYIAEVDQLNKHRIQDINNYAIEQLEKEEKKDSNLHFNI